MKRYKISKKLRITTRRETIVLYDISRFEKIILNGLPLIIFRNMLFHDNFTIDEILHSCTNVLLETSLEKIEKIIEIMINKGWIIPI